MPHTDERGALRPVAAAARDERLWTTGDVAAYFGGCSRSRVRTYVALGLPVIRVTPGARPLFDPNEVRAWAAARKSHSVIEPRERASW